MNLFSGIDQLNGWGGGGGDSQLVTYFKLSQLHLGWSVCRWEAIKPAASSGISELLLCIIIDLAVLIVEINFSTYMLLVDIYVTRNIRIM